MSKREKREKKLAFILLTSVLLFFIADFSFAQKSTEATSSQDLKQEEKQELVQEKQMQEKKKEKLAFSAISLWKTLAQEKRELEFDTPLEVSGVVIDTGISIYLTPVVTLSDKVDGDSYVKCVLPRLDTGKLSSFKKGDRVKLKGHFYSVKSSIVLKKCERI